MHKLDLITSEELMRELIFRSEGCVIAFVEKGKAGYTNCVFGQESYDGLIELIGFAKETLLTAREDEV